jgi:hypothetical protein
MDNTCFHLLNPSCRSREMFRYRDNNTVLPNLRVTCVSVSAAPVFIYLLRTSQRVSSFLGNISWTARQHCDPCFSHEQIYVACSRVGNPTNIYTPAPEGKTKTSVTFQTDCNIPVSLHVFAFLLIVEEDIAFIHYAVFFFLHVCAFASVVDPFVRNMAHISLWDISTIYSVFPFLLHNTQNCYPVSPLVIPGNAGYPC